jgi:hypothetical protein
LSRLLSLALGCSTEPSTQEVAPPDPEGQRAPARSATSEAIKVVVQAHVREVASCHRAPGTVELEWSITAEGRAENVKTLSDSTGDPRVAGCLSDKIRGWTFQMPPGVAQHTFKFAAPSSECTTPAADWIFVTEGTFRYGFLSSDFVYPEDMKRNEAARQEISQFLGVEDTGQIRYFKYPDIATKQRLTYQSANAHSCGRDIHTSSTVDRHELTHILARSLGQPPMLLSEGLAVYLRGPWQDVSLEVYARQALQDGAWRPLAELVDDGAFHEANMSSPVAYGEAGALSWWIVRTYGKDKLLELYRKVTPGPTALEAIAAVLGRPLASVDRDLRAHLGMVP